MKVLHMCSYYISSNLYQHLVKSLDNKKINQIIYIPVDSEEMVGMSEVKDLKNGEYIYSKCFNRFDKFNYYGKINKIYKDLLKNLKGQEIELVHAHSLFINGGVAYKLKQEKNIDYIVAVRSTDINVFFKKAWHLRKFGIEILKNAKKIIFISPSYPEKLFNAYIPKKLVEELTNKTEVIPNGVDQFWIDNKFGSFIKDKMKINLLYVGRFLKRKQIPLSIEATKTLRELGYNASIVIVGKGEQESKIKNMEREYNDFVKVYNWIDGKDNLLKLYREADIFITPSYNETFGIVYLEAISQSLPVIYAKKEGFDGYFKDGEVGYSVDIELEDIVQKIKQINANYSDISKRCYEFIDEYSWDKISNAYKSIYESPKSTCYQEKSE